MRVRRAGAAQSGQGLSDAAPLRRTWSCPCPRRQAGVSGSAEILSVVTWREHGVVSAHPEVFPPPLWGRVREEGEQSMLLMCYPPFHLSLTRGERAVQTLRLAFCRRSGRCIANYRA